MKAYLVCDREDGVKRYEVEENGVVVQDMEGPDSAGQYGLKYEVTGLSEGRYEYRVRACNAVGCSEWSGIFEYEKQNVPQVPMGLGVVEE